MKFSVEYANEVRENAGSICYKYFGKTIIFAKAEFIM